MKEEFFDPRVRASLARFTGGEDTGALEAAAAVRAATRSLERLQSTGTGNRGLSPGALEILMLLSEHADGISIKDLAALAGVTSRNVTGLVDTLEGGDLATRTPSPHDRRSVLVRITRAGATWLDEFRQPAQAAMAALFDGFTPAETTTLRELCLRLTENARHLEERFR